MPKPIVVNGGRIEELSPSDTIISEFLSPDKKNFTSGEALTALDAVYLNSDGKVYKADNSDANKLPAIGFALSSVAADAIVGVQFSGVLEGLSSLTQRSRYYVSTSGSIHVAPPALGGYHYQMVGIANTASSLVIRIGKPIKLGSGGL